MTEIIRTEGVVLRRRDFGESSRIAVGYTRDAGKVQLLARGARMPKNKFGAALEPLSRAEFVFYWRESKDLFTLAATAIIRPVRFIPVAVSSTAPRWSEAYRRARAAPGRSTDSPCSTVVTTR